jgi:hypothetical protein
MTSEHRKVALAISNLICLAVTAVLTVSGSFAQEKLKTFLNRDVFVVKDVNGKTVGPVQEFSGEWGKTPTVAFTVVDGSDKYDIVPCVNKGHFFGDNMLFKSGDCTGTPYGSVEQYAVMPIAAVGPGNSLFLQSSVTTQTITVNSFLWYDEFSGNFVCTPQEPWDRSVVPLAQTAIDLDNEFTPPFKVVKSLFSDINGNGKTGLEEAIDAL